MGGQPVSYRGMRRSACHHSTGNPSKSVNTQIRSLECSHWGKRRDLLWFLHQKRTAGSFLNTRRITQWQRWSSVRGFPMGAQGSPVGVGGQYRPQGWYTDWWVGCLEIGRVGDGMRGRGGRGGGGGSSTSSSVLFQMLRWNCCLVFLAVLLLSFRLVLPPSVHSRRHCWWSSPPRASEAHRQASGAQPARQDQPRVCQLSACLLLRPSTMGSPRLLSKLSPTSSSTLSVLMAISPPQLRHRRAFFKGQQPSVLLLVEIFFSSTRNPLIDLNRLSLSSVT